MAFAREHARLNVLRIIGRPVGSGKPEAGLVARIVPSVRSAHFAHVLIPDDRGERRRSRVRLRRRFLKKGLQHLAIADFTVCPCWQISGRLAAPKQTRPPVKQHTAAPRAQKNIAPKGDALCLKRAVADVSRSDLRSLSDFSGEVLLLHLNALAHFEPNKAGDLNTGGLGGVPDGGLAVFGLHIRLVHQRDL